MPREYLQVHRCDMTCHGERHWWVTRHVGSCTVPGAQSFHSHIEALAWAIRKAAQ